MLAATLLPANFLMESVFDSEFQHKDLDSKIVVALERLSQVFNNLLWRQTKNFNLSPIQIKILIFILTNRPGNCTVSELARKFNLTKATISDAVNSLVEKKLVQKKESLEDKRTIFLRLTKKGVDITEELISWADPIRNEIAASSIPSKVDVYLFLLKQIEALERAGIISVNRMCITCRYFVEANSPNSLHYCNLLKKNLSTIDLRVDCLEHEAV